MPDHEHDARFLGELYEPLGMIHPRCNRLFYQDVFAALQASLGDFKV